MEDIIYQYYLRDIDKELKIRSIFFTINNFFSLTK